MFVIFSLFSRGRSWAAKVFDVQDGILVRFGLSPNEKKVMRTAEKLTPFWRNGMETSDAISLLIDSGYKGVRATGRVGGRTRGSPRTSSRRTT